MKNKGFFNETKQEEKPKKKATKSNCEKCKLSKEPFPLKGKGKLKILIINESFGSYYSTIKEFINDMGFDFNNDFYYMGAISCEVNKIKAVQLSACREEILLKTIDKLKPKCIIPIGKNAIQGLIGHRLVGRIGTGIAIKDFIQEYIPDQVLKTWICPMWHPSDYIFENSYGGTKYDEVIINQNKKILKKAIAYSKKECPVYDFESQCKTTMKEETAIKIINKYLNKDIFAFDYETTGLKPYRKGQKITTVSLSDGNVSYAFPFFESDEFKNKWIELMQSKSKKIAHNVKFENVWTKEKCNTWVKNLKQDTIIRAHGIDNRKKTGLKYLSYVKFGIIGYDEEIEKYIVGIPKDVEEYGTNAFNTMDKAPLKEALLYNAMDSLIEFKLWEDQEKHIDDHIRKGIDFFSSSIEEIAKMEHAGFNYKTDEAKKDYDTLTKKMNALEKDVLNSSEMKKWDKPNQFRLSAPSDLTYLLFTKLKYKVKVTTATGKPKADVETLQQYNLPLIKMCLQWRKLKKIRDTYLSGFLTESINDKIHTSIWLNKVDTYRSCIAKGSLILAAQDFIKYPNGIPIEEIKTGDYIYCFNKNLKLVIKKVLWSGKTGHKKVIRIHYNSGKGGKGYLDVTPEHKIRILNGEYIRADELLDNDLRDKTNPNWKWQPKVRVLSCKRKGDRLFATNCDEELEHRKIYEYFSGEKLTIKDIIHHKDGNHINHSFNNLEKMDSVKHALTHYPETIGTEESKKRSIKIVKRNHKLGVYIYKKGKENNNSLRLTKEDCLNAIKKSKGILTNVPYDFDSFKNNCKWNNIDINKELFFWNKGKFYLDKQLIFSTIKKYGFSKSLLILQIGYFKLKKLCDIYNIQYERGWKNQNGFEQKHIVTLNNHVITKIEYLNEQVDVYDIEVEDEHNFIANEICVHNSCSEPNLQNVPSRDAEVMNLIRKNMVAKKGFKLAEYDYKAMEASIIACYNNDPKWIEYVSNPENDMHRDIGSKLFLKKKEDVTKLERFASKNGFVFPTVYGSYWKNTATSIWEMIDDETRKWISNKNIKTLDDFKEHVKRIERWFWEDQFPVGFEWMNKTIADYNQKGFIELFTGFRCYGPLTRNQIINYRVQGTASHCKLWTLKNVSKQLTKNKNKSNIILEVHDSIIPNVHPTEEKTLDYLMWDYGTQKIREHWDWLNVPLFIEKKISKVNGNWAEMETIGLLKG